MVAITLTLTLARDPNPNPDLHSKQVNARPAVLILTPTRTCHVGMVIRSQLISLMQKKFWAEDLGDDSLYREVGGRGRGDSTGRVSGRGAG